MKFTIQYCMLIKMDQYLTPKVLGCFGLGVIAIVVLSQVLKKKHPTAKEIVDKFGSDLKGKIAIVTGGNSGIGLETCKALASAGCKVYLCSRSIDAANQAIETEIKQSGNGNYVVTTTSNIIVKSLDLETLSSIKSFAQEFVSKESRLDFLVLNAGIMALPTLQRTKAGFERQIGVNHFGHAYLTSFFIPLLSKQTFPSRVVVLSSTAHDMGKIETNDLNFTKGRKYSPWGAYGQSKAANLLYAKALSDQLQHTQVSVLSVHPGVIQTNLWNNGSPAMKIITRLGSIFIMDKTIPQGASSTLWACLSPTAGLASSRGAYISDCTLSTPKVKALSEDLLLRKKFWEATEEALKEGEAVESNASNKTF